MRISNLQSQSSIHGNVHPAGHLFRNKVRVVYPEYAQGAHSLPCRRTDVDTFRKGRPHMLLNPRIQPNRVLPLLRLLVDRGCQIPRVEVG